MGQILHSSAKTTHAVRAAIQRSKASIQELASRYDLNSNSVCLRKATARASSSALSTARWLPLWGGCT